MRRMRFKPVSSVAKKYYVTTEPVPFQERLPLKLKHRVSGKSERSSEVCCLYEMSLLFACLKKGDFNEAVCTKETEAFQKCYNNYLSGKQGRKEKESLGILIPGEKNLSSKQVNTLLKQFPNPK